MKAIIFDFDGVIHDTIEFHIKKIKDLSSIDLSLKEYKQIHTGNFFTTVPEKFKHIDWNVYREYISKEFSELKIKEEIKNVILKLSKKFELSIISSGGTQNIKNYFKNNNIQNTFKEILGQEDGESKEEKFKFILNKYNLTPNECIFVTDTLGDILEANRLNIKSIGVTFGLHDKELLKKGNPSKIISNINELLTFYN